MFIALSLATSPVFRIKRLYKASSCDIRRMSPFSEGLLIGSLFDGIVTLLVKKKLSVIPITPNLKNYTLFSIDKQLISRTGDFARSINDFFAFKTFINNSIVIWIFIEWKLSFLSVVPAYWMFRKSTNSFYPNLALFLPRSQFFVKT